MTSNRALTVAFGSEHPARITEQRVMSWDEYATLLTTLPVETEDKASRGWSIPAEFAGGWRDADSLQRRHALTFDFDHMRPADMAAIDQALQPYEYVIYTTASHTKDKPRLRIVLPLDRTADPDEFQAVSRKLAQDVGLELVSRESHVPAQMMFLPTRKPRGPFKGRRHAGEWVSVDQVLARYENWADRRTWPRRKAGDPISRAEGGTPPDRKAGIVGEFCRVFDIPATIEKFELPYHYVRADRYTYIHGSRAEGVVVYDDGKKLHSHHDTDPARGQHNAFDLLRLHKFGHLDPIDSDLPMAELPSYRAMQEYVETLPEIIAAREAAAIADFPLLLGPPESQLVRQLELAKDTVARPLGLVLTQPTVTRWLLPQRLEAGVLAVMAGPRGVYKSFAALDWAMRCAVVGEPVYVVSAEGGDFDRRARAWLLHHEPDLDVAKVPLFVVERRLDLNTKDGIDAVRVDCQRLGVHPRLFVLDTFSKLSGGLDENNNTEVKQFLGRLDNGLKRPETGFGATVLLIAHTGHTDRGRPRGASAFGADTDAEYIVSRNERLGGVTLSRERFKSSPELAPLYLRPQAVPLGYKDENGEEVSSLVLVPHELRAPTALGNRKLGTVQRMVLDTANRVLSAGEQPSRLLVQTVVEQMTADPDAKRDTRHQSVRKAIDALVAAGLLFMHKGNRVSLTRAPEVTDGEFDG